MLGLGVSAPVRFLTYVVRHGIDLDRFDGSSRALTRFAGGATYASFPNCA